MMQHTVSICVNLFCVYDPFSCLILPVHTVCIYTCILILFVLPKN